MQKLVIEYPILVEGKYDKIKLDSFVEGMIIPVNGFSLFTDSPLQTLLKNLAKETPLVLLLDSDAAGFKLRGFLHSILPKSQIIDLYIPDIMGKERRKTKPSKEGKLGVEGVRTQLLRELLENLGSSANTEKTEITRQDFIDLGLSGGANSSHLRKKLYAHLQIPEHINTKNAVQLVNRMLSRDDFVALVDKLTQLDTNTQNT